MIDLRDKKALEHHFAEHFDTPVFPVLANIYFENGDMSRARKVCDIGLGHHPLSAEGKFILAKVDLVEDNLPQAEKNLKEVVEHSNIHVNALRLLVEVQTALGRSVKTIGSTVEKIVDILVNDEESLRWIEKNKEELSKPEEEISVGEPEPSLDSVKSKKNVSVSDGQGGGIVIDNRMATLTLAKVFRRQKNFSQALIVLDIVENKGGDVKKIEKEREEIYKLIKEQEIH
ncbi:MAG: hypothetical protein HQ510_08945 [Candidatus Marinimicrobia bacterium]|nr:hypothetical protein [Candidatus Neomarinimicrobiota bacterium]